mgnify:CR=1 FL=1
MRDGAYRQDDRMTKTAPKSVAVCLTAAFAGLLVPVAVSLKQRFGTKVHLYVRLPQEKLGFQHLIDSGQADSITLIPSFRSPGPCDQMDDQELFALAREYEKRLSLPLVRLTFTHRFLGRGFNIGGYYYPKSTLLNYKTSYRDQVRYYCNMLRFWENEFTEKTVDLSLQLPHEGIRAGHLAEIPHRRLDSSRYESFWLWTDNEFHSNSRVVESYKRNDTVEPRTLGGQYKGFGSASYFGKRPFMKMVSRIILYTGVYMRRRMKSDMQETIRYWQNVHRLALVYFSRVRLQKKFYKRLADLEDIPFLYLPLHKEPETGLQLMSPEFFHQHAMIVALASSLPAGTVLAIKENPKTMGCRHFSFYEQVSDLKNVMIMDDREPSLTLSEKSFAVSTVTGTAGLEAALLGKPVILFGRHNMFDVLPHAKVVHDFADLPDIVNDAFEEPGDLAVNKSEAERYMGCVIAHSFDAQSVWRNGAFQQDDDDSKIVVEHATQKLLDSLEGALTA